MLEIKNKNRINYRMYIDGDVHTHFKVLCAENRISMSKMINQLMKGTKET